jgi:acyl-ACP thioesterase
MPSPPPPTLWTQPFRVRAYETDPHGTLTIQSLCDYLQEAAGNHAEALNVSVDRLEPLGLAWVLSRLRVEVTAYPRWRESAQVLTWPSGEDRLFATREFLVQAEDGTTLARASSAWLLMNVKRKRPVRLPDFIQALALPDRPAPFPEAPHPLEPPSGFDHERRFRIRYSDLDLNAHVNNARYVEWIAESVPDDVMHQYQMTALQIQYRAETRYGASIRSGCQRIADENALAFTHHLLRADSDTSVALARTRWAPRS